MYPPSLYRAISYVSTLGVPIYIMENGIPAPPDDPSRKRWIVGCLQQVGRCCGPADSVPTHPVIRPKAAQSPSTTRQAPERQVVPLCIVQHEH